MTRIPDYVREAHARYGDYNQTERDDDKLMVKLGHPDKELYVEQRAIFDSLKFACNSSARFVAYAHSEAAIDLWAPHLFVDHNAVGWPADGAAYHRRLLQVAAQGWATSDGAVRTGIHPARIHVEGSKRSQLLETLQIKIGTAGSYAVTKLGELPRLLEVVKSVCPDAVLPRTTAGIEPLDPLPLPQKMWTYGNVESITETERRVLVPLMPLGDSKAQASILEQAVELVKRGYPLQSNSDAMHWFKTFMKAGALHDLLSQVSARHHSHEL